MEIVTLEEFDFHWLHNQYLMLVAKFCIWPPSLTPNILFPPEPPERELNNHGPLSLSPLSKSMSLHTCSTVTNHSNLPLIRCSTAHIHILASDLVLFASLPPHYKAQSIRMCCIQFSYPFSLLGRWHCWGAPTPPRPLFFSKISSVWVCLMFLHGDISVPQSWLQCRPWERGDTSRPCRYPPRHQNNPHVEQLPACLPQPSFMGGLQRGHLTAPFLFPITGS